MTFTSELAAYQFYNQYAKEHGFSIRKSKSRRVKCPSKQICFRRFVCSRTVQRSAKYLTMDGRKCNRRPRAETCCHCKARQEVKLDRSTGLWSVGRFKDNHNRVLARPDEVPYLRSHRKIKDFEKGEKLASEAAGVKKHVIIDNMISKVDGIKIEAGSGRMCTIFVSG